MNRKTGMWVSAVALCAVAVIGLREARAGGGAGDPALFKALPSAKVSLADGIKQAGAKAPEAVTSAKFELDDKGQFSLSVYTSEKGLEVAAGDNVLKELSGSPTGAAWKPEAEVFKDAEHLKEAASQHTMMSIASVSLADVVAKAAKENKGTVFSAIPEVRRKKAVCVVLIADGGKSTEVTYDLLTGSAIK